MPAGARPPPDGRSGRRHRPGAAGRRGPRCAAPAAATRRPPRGSRPPRAAPPPGGAPGTPAPAPAGTTTAGRPARWACWAASSATRAPSATPTCTGHRPPSAPHTIWATRSASVSSPPKYRDGPRVANARVPGRVTSTPGVMASSEEATGSKARASRSGSCSTTSTEGQRRCDSRRLSPTSMPAARAAIDAATTRLARTTITGAAGSGSDASTDQSGQRTTRVRVPSVLAHPASRSWPTGSMRRLRPPSPVTGAAGSAHGDPAVGAGQPQLRPARADRTAAAGHLHLDPPGPQPAVAHAEALPARRRRRRPTGLAAPPTPRPGPRPGSAPSPGRGSGPRAGAGRWARSAGSGCTSTTSTASSRAATVPAHSWGPGSAISSVRSSATPSSAAASSPRWARPTTAHQDPAAVAGPASASARLVAALPLVTTVLPRTSPPCGIRSAKAARARAAPARPPPTAGGPVRRAGGGQRDQEQGRPPAQYRTPVRYWQVDPLSRRWWSSRLVVSAAEPGDRSWR